MPSQEEFPLIVAGCDERYAFPLSVTILSALRSSSRPLQLVILGDQFSSVAKARLKKTAMLGGAKSLEIIDVDLKAFKQIHPGSLHLTAAAFSRLLIAHLLPAESRCIWLDSDVLVRRDLAELWQVDLQGNPVGAVQCYFVPSVGAPYGIPYTPAAQASPGSGYFNSGIMLLDLALWRQQGIEGQTTAFLEQYGNQLNGADQDVLNGVLMNRWHSLPGYWNDQEAANRKPRHGASEKNIRHFSGPQKPWDSGLFDPDCRQWLSIASETGFHSPLEFALWRSRRFCTVLRGTGSNWLRTKGWMR